MASKKLRGIKGMFKKDKAKTTQKLGIDIPRIVNKFMKSEAKNGGFVDKSEYNYFWLAMRDNSPDVDVYIKLLLQYLLNFMTKSNRIPFDAQVLLNTINFLVLRHPTQSPSKEVKDLLAKWYKNKMKYNDQALPAAKDVLGVLHKQRVESKNGLDSLIIQCYQFYSHDELSRIADYYENPTIIHVVDGMENIGRSSGDKVCIWPYLKHLASTDPANFRLVIENTIKKLRTISGQILLLPKLAEISLLALIFMMRQLISYTRVPDEELLNKSIANLKRFYLWPVPYGSQARDLLIELQKERVAPGYALIQKIWRECRLPEIIRDASDIDLRTNTVRSMSSSTTNNEDDEKESDDGKDMSFRPLYYLFDIDDSKSLLYANVMKIDAESDWGSHYKVNSGPNAYISALLLLNIISYDCGKNEKLEGAMKRLNENEIRLFYKQVIEIFVNSSNSNDSKIAKQSRQLGLKEIAAQIIAHANEKEEDDDDMDECVLMDANINSEYRVELPLLHHTGIGCDLKQKVFPSPGQMASNEMLYPSNEVLSKLTSLMTHLHELTANDEDKEAITLRFMIAGGNHILSATATAYASLQRHASLLLSHFNIEFFILPYSKNHYAEWLARMDPWYNRHVFLPLESKIFVAPSLLPDTKSKLRSHGHLHTVGQFYREMSESYAREADQLCKLRLWECLCWESPPYTKTPHQLIPFVQRIEIGKKVDHKSQEEMYQYGASNQIYRNRANTGHYGHHSEMKSNGNYDEYEFEDFDDEHMESNGNGNGNGHQPSLTNNLSNGYNNEYKSNSNGDDDGFEYDSFDYNAIGLDIEWQPVDMLGRAQVQCIDQKMQYLDALSLSSCPRYGDKGFPASPDKAGVIHLHCNVRDTNKKKKFQEYALLKSEPSQHVRTCTIASNRHSEKFYILVDDQIYGKFSRIKVQPMIDPNTKDQVSMPIRTFFPVNV